jgi:hypothetical protein
MTAVQELIKKIKVRIPFFQYSVYQDDFDAAHPTYNNDNEYTEIYLGGVTVITLLEYKQFIELVNINNL